MPPWEPGIPSDDGGGLGWESWCCCWSGKEITWPTCSFSGLTPGLAASMSWSVRPSLLAMLEKVSPARMVYFAIFGIDCFYVCVYVYVYVCVYACDSLKEVTEV